MRLTMPETAPAHIDRDSLEAHLALRRFLAAIEAATAWHWEHGTELDDAAVAELLDHALGARPHLRERVLALLAAQP